MTTDSQTTQKPKRRRRKRRKNLYFTSVHEDAIIEYTSTKDIRRRNYLYEKLIQPAFHKMVEKIVLTYKFNSLPNINYLKQDCKVWLVMILEKYDPSKGYKAFSYFSVVTKNWFIQQVKKNKEKNKREIPYDSLLETNMSSSFERVTLNEYETVREEEEFWSSLAKHMEEWDDTLLKENEKKVLKAVKVLFESSSDIEIFNKKAVYLYLRELTGLNTKQVVNNLKKLRQRYRAFKKKWDEGTI